MSEEERGSGRKYTRRKKDDDSREYGEEGERKKVMGMFDVHLVSVYVYQPDYTRHSR